MDRYCGILLHPTSLPSPYGIGDLGKCAYDFVDFLVNAKQSLWQILPLVPTSAGSCNSPYQSFSAYAGNHLLISPEMLLREGLLITEDLNDKPDFDDEKVEYDKVIAYKNKLFTIAFNRFKNNKSSVDKIEFNTFCDENQYWLNDYALFVSIKNEIIGKRASEKNNEEYEALKLKYHKALDEEIIDAYYTYGVFSLWPDNILHREEKTIHKYTIQLQDELEYIKFLQYNFFKQWTKLKKYANENDIQIVGDLPIFVDYDSADVWASPDIFQMDELSLPKCVAGVPPDYFSETGQLWGSPLYDWDYLKKNNYDFWIKRIRHTLKMVDVIRVDHFRGFESYYSISFGAKTAINGQWIKGPGKDLFIQIEKELGKLPIIAEDLGIITKEVTELRESLGFPGMKVLQFAFDSGAENAYLPHNYKDSNCVVYTGTHDNNTTLGWYSGADDNSKDFLRRYLNVDGDNAHWDLIRLAYSSCAKWVVIPLQDVLMLDESYRMNTPGIAEGNWQFRFTEEMEIDKYAEGLRYLKELFNR